VERRRSNLLRGRIVLSGCLGRVEIPFISRGFLFKIYFLRRAVRENISRMTFIYPDALVESARDDEKACMLHREVLFFSLSLSASNDDTRNNDLFNRRRGEKKVDFPSH
jgi:hypothetical protein